MTGPGESLKIDQLVNESDHPASYLEIGDREAGDRAHYPKDDLIAQMNPQGKWEFTKKDGTPY